MSIINPIKCYDGNSYTNLDAKNIAFTSSLTGITLDNTGGSPSLQDALIQINNNKVSKAGDTMTGNLIMKSTTMPGIDETPSSIVGGLSEWFLDKNGDRIGYLNTFANQNGYRIFEMVAARLVNGIYVAHGLQLGINANGTRYVGVTDAAPWRSALGVDTLSSTSFTSNGGTVYLRKATNGLVTIDGSMDSIAASQTSSTSTIPSGYRPARTLYLVGWDSGNNMRRVRIGSNGKITPYSGTTTGIWFCATYSTT